ncbi:MAG: 1-deoxy-D-xylulose-5-phosphate reductoisomerase [Chloroflexota bacterium]
MKTGNPATNLKRLAVLGCTGSIGRQTLDVVRAHPGRFKVVALAGGGNVDLLLEQAREFRPEMVSSPALHQQPEVLKALARGQTTPATMEEMAAHPDVDLVVIATSGKAGLSPCFAALRQGKAVALANKEVLVMAGELVTAEARQHGAQILPIDSEHSALWQCLRGEDTAIARLILTASGGPFRGRSAAELAGVTAADALRHPTWDMGPKVTIDSATLMNKGMEIIEAHWLFQVPLDHIQVVLHPESIIHSMVEFVDGSVKAQLSYPDMRLPIQYALSYPERLPGHFVPSMDFSRTKNLTFEDPDWQAFPCPLLAMEAGKKGGTYPAALCAADEVAVAEFLAGHIGFMDIPRIVEGTLGQHHSIPHPSLADTIEADAWAREKAHNLSIGVRP